MVAEYVIGIIVLSVIASALNLYAAARARQIAQNGYFFIGVFVQLIGIGAAIFIGYQIMEILNHV